MKLKKKALYLNKWLFACTLALTLYTLSHLVPDAACLPALAVSAGLTFLGLDLLGPLALTVLYKLQGQRPAKRLLQRLEDARVWQVKSPIYYL